MPTWVTCLYKALRHKPDNLPRRSGTPPRKRCRDKDWAYPETFKDPPKSLISLQPRNEQAQSPLFGARFPAELRIIVYETVLGDPSRLLHLILFNDETGRVGHRRCEDQAHAGPTWQHRCFGTYLTMGISGRAVETFFYSNDKLLALLLSCHRIYCEAIAILYTANEFSVKGSMGLLGMRSVITTPQWHNIRYLNLSTMFFMPQALWQEYPVFPPDNYQQWSDACEALADLRGLLSFHLEIIVWDMYGNGSIELMDEDSLVSILAPLNRITAPRFEVEMNFAIPETVQRRIGTTSFTIVVRQRPWDHGLSPL